ncbi:MAG TPA: glycine/sarcosine/betaine reductase selenoprotein B family protein [Pseudomonadales bacterium]|nr:glycine/sarcosine/betaine reductase selenoprotein B family protein [Pseudomonadales bacterium]
MTRPDATSDPTPPHDLPVPYMQRLRDYYLALGYGNPYRWAHHEDVPFTPLAKPLAESRVALVTTAAPHKEGAGDQGPHAAYNAAAKFYRVYTAPSDEDRFVGISHLGYDRAWSTAEDPDAFFPLPALRRAARQGRIGAVAPRYYGAPTNRSQETTVEQDAADVLRLIREDQADVALLVPS